MEISENPPSSWDTTVTAPCQTIGFARAMRALGYQALYLTEGNLQALALARGMFYGIRRLTARANLFAPDGESTFALKAIQSLAELGIAHVKVGDTMWGFKSIQVNAGWPLPRTEVIQRHTFALDLSQSEESILKGQETSVRTSLRKAEREGVRIRELTSEADLESYIELAAATSARVRGIAAYTNFPPGFFRELYYGMSPNGSAKLYIAYMGETPLAGGIFFCSKDRMLYFAGASSRDRKWTSLQAPTALLWHAIREAKRLRMALFDFGGCTPTEDTSDPRYRVYAFKKRWGGSLEVFYNLEVILSPLGSYLQERILSPLWNHLHPLYFKLAHMRKEL
jgi:lipid II:glycine glycyltransferase (peptidoglycan interpeptide bridge formation enzyme)